MPKTSTLLRLLLGIVVIVTLFDNPQPLVVIPLLFVLVVPFEKFFPRHDQQIRRPDLANDVSYAVAAPVLDVFGIIAAATVGIFSFAWLPGLALRPLVSGLDPTVRLVVGVLLFDLAAYWIHRWAHEVPQLWKFHAVHHSTETLDWISGFRAHPFDGALVAPPFFLLLAAGFAPEVAGGLAVVQLVSGLFLHANVSWRLRPLQRLIATPEFHHWHHANEPDAINKDYSALLPVWDIVFGTWFMPRDRRPEVYGINEEMPAGLTAQLRHPLRDLRPIRSYVRHPLRTLRGAYRHGRLVAGLAWKTSRRPTHRALRDPAEVLID